MKLQFNEHGVEIKRNYISRSIIEAIKSEVSSSKKEHPKHGIRSADKKFKTIKQLAHSSEFIGLADTLLGSKPNIVRVIFFDKTPDINWLVTWHQDKTIALNKKAEVIGGGLGALKIIPIMSNHH